MKKKKKSLKTKKSHSKNFGIKSRWVNYFVLLTLILVPAFLLTANSFTKQLVMGRVFSQMMNSDSSPTPVSTKSSLLTIVPYPTATPAPTPVPLTGYCLRVPILTYHHIQPQATAVQLKQTSLNVDNGIFDQQMSYLASKGYTSIWAIDLINALKNHTALPSNPVMVTMDDGYADNDTYALPVLKKYNIKANLMLATGLVGSNPDMLSWSQVQDMKNSGLYYFTNHTWSHYAITNGPQSKIESEIDTAASQIKQYLGEDVNTFTYPYGAINTNAIQTLQKKGYAGGFSTIPGQYQCDSFIMTLHRSHIGNAPLSAYGL